MTRSASDEPVGSGAPPWVLAAFARSVFALDDAAVFAKGLDGRYLLCNETGARIVGLTPADIVGRTDHELYEPVIADRFREHDLAVLTSARSSSRWIAIPAPTGVETWFSHLFPLVDPSGDLVGVIGMSLDVTERAESELERRELERRLQQAQRLETVGQLAGGVAHDFNNLLAVMAMQTDLLTDEIGHDASGRLEELRATIERASDLTRQLLAFSRHEDLGAEATDLPRVLHRLRPILERSLGTGIRLTLDVPDALARVPADPAQIEQLIVNLATNARDAMPDGGRITLRVDQLGDEGVRIVFTDTGVGMTEEVRSKAFEPFFTTKPPGVGTGLGLSTVHGIVHRSGGVVVLHPRPSGGTAVEVRLPPAPDTVDEDDDELTVPEPALAEPRHERSDPDGTDPGRRITILVVDDLEPLRSLASAALQRAGHRTLVAADGPDALAIAANEEFDLLLTDIVMPGMSGRELADRLLAGRPDLPVVFMTGYTAGMLELADFADSAGAEILTKPFAVAELLDAIDRQVARLRRD